MAVAEAWLASGLTAAEFAQQNGVTTASLARWHRELKQDARDGISDDGFIELTVRPDTPEPSAIEIIIDERHRVLIGPGFDESTLTGVLNVLDRRRDDGS